MFSTTVFPTVVENDRFSNNQRFQPQFSFLTFLSSSFSLCPPPSLSLSCASYLLLLTTRTLEVCKNKRFQPQFSSLWWKMVVFRKKPRFQPQFFTLWWKTLVFAQSQPFSPPHPLAPRPSLSLSLSLSCASYGAPFQGPPP